MNDPVIVDILIELHCLEIIVNQIEQTRLISIHNEDNNEYADQAQEIKIGYWDWLKILSSIKHDILPEFRRYGVIEILIDELDMSRNPFHQISVMETLINLSMDDQNAVQIREWGIHIIGK